MIRILFFLIILIVPGTLLAQEESDFPIMCATIWACNEDGSVMEQFRGGSCEQVYALQCRQMVTLQSLDTCEIRSEKLRKRVRAQKKRIRRLRAQN